MSENLLSKKLNMNIPYAICISLENDEKRRQDTIHECNKIGLPVKFKIVKKHPQGGVEGCKDSHKQVIQYAKDNNLENILVLEDDILFNDQLLLNMKPITLPTFEMFYLGYHINRGNKVSDQLLHITSALTTHAYIMNHSVYDIFLNYIDDKWDIPEFKDLNDFERIFFTNNLRAVDMFYAKYIHHARGKTYGLYPMIAYQRPEFSTIENKNVDYKNLFIEKANYFASKIKSCFIAKIYHENQDEIFNAIKTKYSNVHDYDYFHVQPIKSDFCFTQEIKNSQWDILYITDNEYLIRKQAIRRKDDNMKIKYFYPGSSPKPGKEWLSDKPILCLYDSEEDNHMIRQLENHYHIFYCSEKYNQIQNNHFPKHLYHFIPTNQVLLKNDISFFVDHAITKPNIILWMTQDTFDYNWKCDWWHEKGEYQIPHKGKALFTNMSMYIITILFDTQEICDSFCNQYNVVFNPQNMFIISNGKHNYDLLPSNPVPWKIVCETNGKNFMQYIQTFKILLKQNPNLSIDIYGCTKNNKKKFQRIKNTTNIKCFKNNIDFSSADIFLMLENNEKLYWKAKMGTCFIISSNKYSYMSVNDVIIEQNNNLFETLNRDELKRLSFDEALQQKTNNSLINFFIK
jgi:glycosyl transferase family 25